MTDTVRSSATETRDGRSTRWDPHRKERREAIIAAAVSAIEQYGPDVLTGQIAEVAGVPRTHVYRHFEGKQALDLAVSAHIGSELGRRIRAGLASGDTARSVISGGIEEHLAWIEAHPHLYRFIAQHAYAARGRSGADAIDAKAALATEISGLVRGYARGLGAQAPDVDRIIVGVVGLVDATAAWWLEAGEPARAELARELTDRVWLLIADAATGLGLTVDPDQPLPAGPPD